MERSFPEKENWVQADQRLEPGESCERYQARPCWSVAKISNRLLRLCAMTTRARGTPVIVPVSGDQLIHALELAAVSWRIPSPPEGVRPSRTRRPLALGSAA